VPGRTFKNHIFGAGKCTFEKYLCLVGPGPVADPGHRREDRWQAKTKRWFKSREGQMFTVNREITAKRYNNGNACAYRLETSIEVFSYKMSTQHKLLSFPPIQRLEHKEAAKRQNQGLRY
jgi:hypothetical protein